ncbi:MAG: c-type cytochrome [Bacteroidia bacterium]
MIADSGSSEIYQLCTGKINPENRPKSDADRAAFASQPGNPQKGNGYFSQKAQCQNCHKVAGWGGDFGPDLSHVGSSKTVKQLITAVLNPSAEISPEWQGWFVTTAEGQTFYGRQIDVGLNNAELLNVTGEFVNYKNPKKYGMASASLMPEGLENMLTEEEFRDLIAWLSSLK